MKKNTFWLAVFSILLLAVFLRFYQLGSLPASLYWDEAAILLDSWSVAETGRDWLGNSVFQRIFASYGDFKLPVYIWFSSVSVKFFGASAWAVRLPSAITGVLSVVLSAAIAKDLWLLFVAKNNQDQIDKNNLTSLRLLQIAALLVAATSYWGIHFSRAGFESHLGQLFLSLTIWGLLQTLLHRGLFFSNHSHRGYNVGWLLVSAISAGLAIFTYYSVRFVLPGVVLELCLLFWWKNRGWLHHKKIILRTAIASLFSLLVMGLSIFFFSGSPLFDASQQIRLSTESILNSDNHIQLANKIQFIHGRSLLSRILYHREIFRAEFLLRNMAEHFSPDFLYLTGDANLRHGTGEHGLLSIIFLPILLISIWKLNQKSKPLLLFLLGWWILSVLPASAPYEVPHALRSLNAFQPIMLFHAFGLYFVWQWLLGLDEAVGKKWYWFGRLLAACLALLVTASSFLYLYHYATQYSIDSRADWQSGYREMAQFIKTKQAFYSKIWVVPPDERWFLWLLLAQEQPPTLLPSLERNGYFISGVENVSLIKPTCEEIDFETQLLVGNQRAINSIIEECQLKTNIYHTINAPTKEPIVAASGKL